MLDQYIIRVHCTFRSRCAMLSEWRWAMAIVTCRTMAAASEKASGKHLNKLYTISTFNLQQFVVLRTLMLWLILSCSMKSPINLHFVTPTSLGKRRITLLLNSLKQLSTSHATRKQLFSCENANQEAESLESSHIVCVCEGLSSREPSNCEFSFHLRNTVF